MDNLMGVTFQTWLKLLRENNFAIDPQARGRSARITLASFLNSYGKRNEQARFGEAIAAAQVSAPLFVIGHWRSGTTFLHELLALDEQFAYATLFQVSNPDMCLVREQRVAQYLEQADVKSRPMDQVTAGPFSPGEDEFGVATMTGRSPVVAWSFPRNEAFYDRFLTFQDATPKETATWQAGLDLFLRKLAVRYPGRRLLLKSPPHTARVRLLLQMYPQAQFVHIRREPYTVFSSTQRLFATAIKPTALQAMSDDQVTEGILRRYQLMYEALFTDRPLIPAGNFHEISFEALERDTIGTIRSIYEALQLPGYAEMAPKLQARVAQNAGYQKNKHPEIEPSLKQRIARTWQHTFEQWGYPS